MKPPIDILHLFPELNDRLITLLRSLRPDDWHRQTIAGRWTIKDVASHLLDGNFRRIALHRDNWQVPPDREIRSYQDLVNFLNDLNADWVIATKRLSPQILIELLESTNSVVYEIFCQLDPYEKAAYPVSWAGEELSQNWFDLAREYTERWHHQQQIRDAIGNNDLMSQELYGPLLNTFMYAWPHVMQQFDAPEGSLIKTTITGEGGGHWYLYRRKEGWSFSTQSSNGTPVVAETVIDGEFAWKLFSKSLRKNQIEARYEIKGDPVLGNGVLEMVSVMA